MQCDKYLLDVSAIQDYIKKADGSVKEKIKKKIKNLTSGRTYYSGLGGIWTHDHRLRRTVPYPY